jgi:hypothetical protein
VVVVARGRGDERLRGGEDAWWVLLHVAGIIESSGDALVIIPLVVSMADLVFVRIRTTDDVGEVAVLVVVVFAMNICTTDRRRRWWGGMMGRVGRG